MDLQYSEVEQVAGQSGVVCSNQKHSLACGCLKLAKCLAQVTIKVKLDSLYTIVS